jgi:hypothetical protein
LDGCLNQYTDKYLEFTSPDTGNMLFTESFLKYLIKAKVMHTVYSDARRHVIILALNTYFIHHIKKSIVERTIKYLKDRTRAFDDYYPRIKPGLCNLKRVHNGSACLSSYIIH